MLEIAEIRDEMRKTLEEKRKKASTLRYFLYHAFITGLALTPVDWMIVWFFIGIISEEYKKYFPSLLTSSTLSSLGFLLVSFLTIMINVIVFGIPISALLTLNYIHAKKYLKSEVALITALQKDKYAFPELSKLFKLKEELERWKILINYDFSKKSSYPNRFGSNICWSDYNELKKRNLICDSRIKELISQKVKEFGGT